MAKRRRKVHKLKREIIRLLKYWQAVLISSDEDESQDKSSRGRANRPILKLIEQLIAGRLRAPVLARLARITLPKTREVHHSKLITYYAALNHKGQFNGGIKLNPSQRHAVHRALTLPRNEFLAVSGPPGTGKTTLLQSIIASLYVDAAIRKKKAPPIIVCTGATNQSVENVINCLGRSAADDQILASRWLPHLFSYGTFCMSKTRSEQSDWENYQQELRQDFSYSEAMHQREYYAKAEQCFREKAYRYFGERCPRTIRGITKCLHRELILEHKLFIKNIDTISGKGLVHWFKTLIGKAKPISKEEFEAHLVLLDEVQRYRLFLLAARYWEGRWLIGFSKAAAKLLDARNKNDGYLPTGREHWERRALITPAFVATLSMTASFFRPENQASTDLPIDLLIFDEAGQIPPEIGVPLTALTHRALIIGDTKQLEPMRSIPSEVDEELAAKAGLLGILSRDKEWDRIKELGIVASSGSLMLLAQNLSRITDFGRPGPFLSDQRRSVPEIVAFCNELSYNGELKPIRKDTSTFLPPFYLFDIKSESQQIGTSRANYEEIFAISTFIETYRKKLLLEYAADDISEVLAVITAHKPQADELKRKLGGFYKDLVVGTIHSLQGAERPVVLFSTVYGESYRGKLFFDQNPNMLNVAVSRARDSFIVFGNRNLFDLTEDRPSSLLGRYITRDYGKSLSPTFEGTLPVHFSGKIKLEVKDSIIQELKDHRYVLRTILEQAKERIIIVSPTISALAIREDNIVPLIERAIKRGVEVNIVADYLLTATGDRVASSQEGLGMLNSAGARIIIARGIDGIHAKRLAADGEVYITGSFNWLSAVRNEKSQTKKIEESTIHTGEKAFTKFYELHKWMLEVMERQSAAIGMHPARKV